MRKIKSLFNFVFKNKYLGYFVMNRAGRDKDKQKISFRNKGEKPDLEKPKQSKSNCVSKIRIKSLFYTKIIIYVRSLQVKNPKCPNFGDV